MRRIARGLMVALLGALLALSWASPATASGTVLRTGCGTTGKGGTKLRVNAHGNVSCKRAKRVAYSFYFNHDKWDQHGTGGLADIYWSKGAWRCGYGAGGGGCTRQRDDARIYYQVLP